MSKHNMKSGEEDEEEREEGGGEEEEVNEWWPQNQVITLSVEQYENLKGLLIPRGAQTQQ